MMNSIALEVEKGLPDFWDIDTKVLSTDNSAFMVKAAVEASASLPVKGIIADTYSGNTVRGLAAYRGKALIYAHCYSLETMRALALSYGVYARFVYDEENHDAFLEHALDYLLRKREYSIDDTFVAVAGSFGKGAGTSLLEIGSIGQLKEFIKKGK